MRPTLLIPILGALAMVPATAALAGGCGGCGPAGPVLYAQPPVAPVLYAQPAPAPTIYAWPGYSTASCGGCGYSGYGATVIDTEQYWRKQPIYVVNQGPHYSGPGIMIKKRTWSNGSYAGDYPYAGGYPGWYDGGPYADPLGRSYVRRYGYHEQIPAGYDVPPAGPRIITRSGYAPRYSYAPRHYVSPKSPRYYAPRHRPVVVRANAEVRQMGNRLDVRLYRTGPVKKNRYHGY